MEAKTFNVPNVSCSHCIMTIQRELNEIEGVSKVVGDPDKKQVTVEWEFPAILDQIKAALQEINYPPAE
jgi:copper chaperone